MVEFRYWSGQVTEHFGLWIVFHHQFNPMLGICHFKAIKEYERLMWLCYFLMASCTWDLTWRGQWNFLKSDLRNQMKISACLHNATLHSKIMLNENSVRELMFQSATSHSIIWSETQDLEGNKTVVQSSLAQPILVLLPKDFTTVLNEII